MASSVQVSENGTRPVRGRWTAGSGGNLHIVCHEALPSRQAHLLVLSSCASRARELKGLKKHDSRWLQKLSPRKLPESKVMGGVLTELAEVLCNARRAGAISLISWVVESAGRPLCVIL